MMQGCAGPASRANAKALEALPQTNLLHFMWEQRGRFSPGLIFAISRVLVIVRAIE